MTHTTQNSSFVRPLHALARSVVAIVALLFCFPSGTEQIAQATQSNPASPLEVRITKPVQWVKDCLSVSLDRINRSDATLYLPVSGIYMDSSIIYSANRSGDGKEQSWINLYGVFDIVSFDATALSPGATRHEEICYIRPTVLVTNRKEKTIRRIPIRGTLRIDAYFFLTKEDWLRNKTLHEEIQHSPPDWRGKTGDLNPQITVVETTIPCYGSGCRAGCDNSPVVFDGELNFLFNASDVEWEARGKAINENLAHKSPSCAETLEPK